VAERLGRGLQSPVQRFESARRLLRWRAVTNCAALLACIAVAPALAGSARIPRTPPLSYTAPRDIDYVVDGSAGDAEDVAMGDLNGDGRTDLAIISDENGTVSVVLNNGGGSFSPVATYETPMGGEALIADLNGDGSRDLVVASPRANAVSVLLNRGDGTLLPRVDYSIGSRPNAHELPFALADLTGDGRPDIVAAIEGVRQFFVLLNVGDGTFAATAAYATVSKLHGIVAGDLNGDGKADVVVPNYRARTVSVFLNRGDGTFGARSNIRTGARPYTVALADFNGDRRLDVATGNCCTAADRVSLLLNRGGRRFAPRHEYRAGDPRDHLPLFLEAMDLNGDRRPDLVYGGVRLNRGGGRFEPELCCAGGAIGDLNGDGQPDQAYSTLDDVWVRYADPNVCNVQIERGKTLAVAARTLALSNCRVGRVRYTHSAKVKRHRVLAQKPARGVWRKGRKVDLVISLGPG
jgi:FG-GAP-like repeat